MTIGERIKNRRLELGMSQSELAKRIGCNAKSSISKLETQGDNITTDRIKRVAAALNCSEADLMGWSDNKTQENAAFSVAMLKDSNFLSHAKKLFYANGNIQEQVYSYIDFLIK